MALGSLPEGDDLWVRESWALPGGQDWPV